MDHLQTIIIPTTVTSIRDECFFGCKSLLSLVIPTTVKFIGIDCFCKCSSLTQILLPLNENSKYPFKVSYGDYSILKKNDIVCEKVVFTENDLHTFRSLPNDVNIILMLLA
ncbi:hypothetical protein QTN25_001396 [Entamoeba marina]